MENDIGKYDKSLPANYLISEIAEIWYNSHVRSVYSDRASSFTAVVDTQRRSGDATTFLGNTIINQAACLALCNPDNILCGMYAGDNHRIFGKNISNDTSL